MKEVVYNGIERCNKAKRMLHDIHLGFLMGGEVDHYSP